LKFIPIHMRILFLKTNCILFLFYILRKNLFKKYKGSCIAYTTT